MTKQRSEAIAIPQEDWTRGIILDQEGGPVARMDGVTPQVELYTHAYQSHLFAIGDDFVDRVEGIVIKFRTNLLRNYESPYDPNDIQPPTCFSSNGVHGSRPMEVREIAGKSRRIYGECKPCFFNAFGTGGVCYLPKARRGKNCSQYGILWLLCPDYEVRAIQVPPTGVAPIEQGILNTLRRVGGKMEHANRLWWNVLPAGGGKQGGYLSIIPVRAVSPEDLARANEALIELETWDEEFYQKFVSGGGTTDSEAAEAEESVRVGTPEEPM